MSCSTPLSHAIRRLLLLAAFVGATVVVARGAEAPAGSTPERAPKELAALKYRSLGPAWGGRVSRASGVAGNPSVYYAATASGGVWQSLDGGITWKPVFDDQPVSSIGSIAVAPSDPNVVYVGSGEANIRGNVAAGNGIYKSVDAGKTWTHVWTQEGQIGTMVVHPKDPDIAFAAVLGHAFGPNPERGVYRTRDGGKTWQQVLAKDADTGASDVTLDPSNPRIVFAGMWQARRRPWELVSGGPGSGLYVSRDGGDSWTQLSGHGLPGGIWGKVGVAVAPSDRRRVYALIEAEDGGLFRSDDGGESWSRISAHRALRQRAWYYSTLTVHPTNANEVWFPQVPLLKTIDGGKTIERVRGTPHGDHHDAWIDPANPRRMIIAHDGGVGITLDGGETWFGPRLPIGQFYHVTVDSRVPFFVAGSQQDIGTAQGPSNNLRTSGPTAYEWHGVGGGEAGHVVSDPTDPNIVYAGEYLGILTRYDHRTRQARNVSAWPDNPSGWSGHEMKYRFQWTAPIAISPHDPKVVYHAAQVLFRTDNGGESWSVISPDLTRNDKAKQQWSGGPITGDNTGVETYGTIFAVAESPIEPGLIWAGSDDGLVHVTRDAGKTWTNMTTSMRGMPEWGTISMIEPSRFDAATAYVIVDAHRLDDMRPYLFRTTDYGRTWVRLDGALPRDVYLHVVREDPVRRDLLYLGTERGVVFSTDGGGTWKPLQLNLPTVAVHDMQVNGPSLVLGTHGRSVWILDDLQAVREVTPEITSRDLHVLPAGEVVAWRYASGPSDKSAGENPPRGAAIYYWLGDAGAGKAQPRSAGNGEGRSPGGDVVPGAKHGTEAKAPDEEVTLDVLDSSGAQVRRLSSVPIPPTGSDDFEEPLEKRKGELQTGPGVHRAVWNLRYEGARRIKDAKIDSGDPDEGPFVPPGAYTLRLTAGGKSATSSIQVTGDPRSQVSAADLQAQAAFALQVRDDISRLTDTVNALRGVRDQVRARRAAMAGLSQASELVAASDALLARLDELEDRLHNPKAEVVYDILAMKTGAHLYSRLAPLMSLAIDGDGAPTQGMRDVHAELRRELGDSVGQWHALVSGDVASLNAKAASTGLGFVIVPE